MNKWKFVIYAMKKYENDIKKAMGMRRNRKLGMAAPDGKIMQLRNGVIENYYNALPYA